MHIIKHFKWDFLITAVAIIGMYLYGGVATMTLAVILIVLEMVFSFDNAAVNAKYLKRLNHHWRIMFLTVGVLIAVFGMRLVFPFVIVWITSGLAPGAAWSLAMEKGDPSTPGTYGYILAEAHPTIAAFGSMFLLMLFLSYFLDRERDSTWLGWIERPMIRAGHFDSMTVITAMVALLLATEFLTTSDDRYSVLLAGTFGILTYLLVNGLSTFMEAKSESREHALEEAEAEAVSHGEHLLLAGKAAFSTFLFLEVLDASFSFDGVLGAFAITSDPIVIAVGLGIGALFVRSMTIYLVENNSLDEFEFMEAGAHWAIGILALLLLLTIKIHIPEWVIGLAGVAFIASSIMSSKRKNRADSGGGPLEDDAPVSEVGDLPVA